MSASTFIEYASSPHLTEDEIYTIELLIERTRTSFDPDTWNNWSERGEARETRNYRPVFAAEHVRPAAEVLKSLTWISFQRINDAERPVRDLQALRYLPALSELVLINCDVSDLTPIANSTNLTKLHLNNNPISDLRPLAGCVQLTELHLEDAPVQDLRVLQDLRCLRELSLSANQLAAFSGVACLPVLQKLSFGLEAFTSFVDLPAMPELRIIEGAHVSRLDGLERFHRLENLVNISGAFQSLDPLRDLKRLTHVNVLRSKVRSVEPLRGLTELRAFFLRTDAVRLEFDALRELPNLHEIGIDCNGAAPPGLQDLQSRLLTWDTEFLAKEARHVPSLNLEIVDQATFDAYNTEQPFNVNASCTNEGMLRSELDWLDHQLEALLAIHGKQDEDYAIPLQWRVARSRTVVIYSELLVQKFRALVLAIQAILCRATNDCIVYFQSDGVATEFEVWVYPWKVMVPEKHASAVRKLASSD